MKQITYIFRLQNTHFSTEIININIKRRINFNGWRTLQITAVCYKYFKLEIYKYKNLRLLNNIKKISLTRNLNVIV